MNKKNLLSVNSNENFSSLIDLKRKFFNIRVSKIYSRDEFIRNNKVFRREIARLKTFLNQ